MKEQRAKRLSIIIPIIVLLIVTIALIYNTSRNWSGTVANMEKALGEQVVRQASTFCDKINNELAVLEGLATTFTREDVNNVKFIDRKINQSANKTDFVTVSFIYPDGHLYRNDGKEINVADRSYFQSCMEGNDYVTYIKNPEMDDAPKLGLGVPVIIEGEIVGVLMGTYDVAAFQKLLEECISDISALSYICGSDGKFIVGTSHATAVMEAYEPGITQNGGFFDVLDKSEFSRSTKLDIVENMKRMQGGQAAYTYQSEKRYTTYEPLGINDWFIVTVLPEEQIYDNAMSMASNFYIMLGIILITIIAVILYLTLREHKMAVSEKERAVEFQYRLEHDELTGVLSEKAFISRVEERIKDAEPEKYCLVYMDVYKFKLINEMFGYDKGDELLCAIAQEIQKMAQNNDGLCGRISGDKFILFLPNREKLLNEFRTRKLRKERIVPLELYLHYGIYIIRQTEIPIDQMIDRAQLAQKSVKGNYDNYIAFYDEKIGQQIMKEQEILNSMSKALENGEFVIYLQPQYNYKEGVISGAEALVRWIHPEKGLVPPGDFIPIFETNGFIIKLDENVWEQVCMLLRKWIDEGKEPLPISVNVSRADLLKGDVAEKLMGLLKKYDLKSELLRVEITETAYMDNPQQLIMEIDRLRDNGLLVEMDDFGSGYSSLNMLKDVPIQVLKTDLKFLAGTGIEKRKESILDSIISMAHRMGMRVIAEGVETKEQADYLLKLNCEHMQGYYFSRPVPVEEFEKMVYSI